MHPTHSANEDDTCPDCELRLTGGYCPLCGQQWYVSEPIQQTPAFPKAA